MDQRHADEYLERIGLSGRPPSGLGGLRTLMTAHLRTVPFENLSIHLGEEYRLDEEGLHDKVVGRRRGGFCYELGGAFAGLLRALGHDVTLLAARVHGEDGLGPPFDHLALRVDLADGPWLVDVGFGRFVAGPVPFAADEPWEDPEGVVTWAGAPDGDLDVLLDGRPQYRLETRPRELVDAEPTCWWQTTSPRSHFTAGPVCSLPTADGGRVSLAGRTLVTTAADGTREERRLGGDDEVLATYRDLFGVVLDRVP
ncbi:arylamine N-acetyltransferase family protein [Phycicoccus flavus]|uniref:Arylamine N-acetyltransferase n=1 Tax=Phycicoccus flavus TaxID=2502783 RepID=A0A8T6R7N8_9MICO|nr:arylamine N-acetyltransferase [Phycicoccus flavus]NHA69553.1 arylamine N-acetyltransferase [Phycicoccus flavus]